MNLIEVLFAPILPFVAHPGRIAAVAILFGVLFLVLGWRQHRWSWPLLWAAGAWATFALWEWSIWVQQEEANIRVDLLLIYPLLLGLTLWALWRGSQSQERRR